MSDKISGALFGAAVGDCIGAPFEGLGYDENRVPTNFGGGMFNLAPGETTDDTLMTLDLAETWMECGTFDRDRFLNKMILTVRKDPKTFGRTTKTLVDLLEQGCFAKHAAYVINLIFGGITNGSLMRTVPVGLAYKYKEAGVEAEKISAYTHSSHQACTACRYVSDTIAGLVSGMTKNEVLEEVPNIYLEGELKPSVLAFDAARCAFTIFKECGNYYDTILKICRLGGDTDTIASIAGGMAGACYGIDSIPKEWIDSLLLKNRIQKAADAFTSARL